MNECCSLTRGDYAASKEKNLCHVSDSPAAAEAEINLWFKPEEILTWDHVQTTWLCWGPETEIRLWFWVEDHAQTAWNLSESGARATCRPHSNAKEKPFRKRKFDSVLLEVRAVTIRF
jgi:hypothetical protein